jgi:hypothetical protein
MQSDGLDDSLKVGSRAKLRLETSVLDPIQEVEASGNTG